MCERRKHKRFELVCDSVAFIRSSRPDQIMVATIVDVSIGGLSVMHFSEELPPSTSLDLDIVLPGGEALLPALNGLTIWDNKIDIERQKLFPQRRCGIAFHDLSPAQESYLKSLVHHYTGNGLKKEGI